jgi:hypothetical protein
MKTYVILSDYNALKKCMTEEEIKEKYGRLVVIKKEEYKECQIKLKRMK